MPTDRTITLIDPALPKVPFRINTLCRLVVLIAGFLILYPSFGFELRAQSGWVFEGVPALDTQTRDIASAISGVDSAVSLLTSWYSSHGYFEFRLDSVSGTTLHFFEGARYSINSVTFNPGEIASTNLSSKVTAGTPYSDSIIQASVSNALDQLEGAGYALASVSVGGFDVEASDSSITVNFEVDPGEPIVVASFQFEGGGNTSESFLRRVAGTGVGRLYDPELIDRVRSRLYRTGLFEPIPFPEIRLVDSGRVDLVFGLRPRSVNSFDGAIGYQPSTELESGGFLTGSIDVRLRNVFGSAESIVGSWSKLDESTSDLSLGFATPYVFGLPFGVDLSFSQIVEDETGSYTSYVERALQGVVTAEIGGEWLIEAGGSFSALISSPDTLLGPCSSRQLPMSSSHGGLVGIRYDSRDFPLNPKSGALYRSRFGFGTREVQGRPVECDSTRVGSRSHGRQSIAAELLYVQPFGGPIVGAGHIRGRVAAGEEFEFSELYRFGGTNSVRGYREGAFRGTRTASATVEGRFLLSEVSHAGVFVDGGYVYRPQLHGGEPAREDLLLGYGVAFQVDTPAGVVRFSVGLARGAPVDDATISVGLVGSF